ncbi:metallophosphoesterase [Tessaracoccus sp. OS52]|uniref:metallophosphoesterase n=1 Tax=Tessaracoccus sp. OS52 TaxID=2886691 RepID=UPI001D1298EE|nr:metallophosphoesterase [Tessaracoccus sp. OS52]
MTSAGGAVEAQRDGSRRQLLFFAIVLALVGVVALFVRMQWEVSNTRLTTVTHSTGELGGEFRLLQLTDFHNLSRPGQIDEIIELARAAEADVIAVTGDLVNTHNASLDPARRLIEGLVSLGPPVFYVDGNHDHWSPEQSAEHQLLRELGVEHLVNEAVPISGRWGTLSLVGVDDYYSGHGDLAASLESVPRDGFRFVITHSPQIFPELVEHGVDYAVCGHTHGGQVRLPLVGALYTPGEMFPRFDKGAYRQGATTMYIDSGIGVTGPPVRLLNQSQITLHVVGPQG